MQSDICKMRFVEWDMFVLIMKEQRLLRYLEKHGHISAFKARKLGITDTVYARVMSDFAENSFRRTPSER